MAEMTGRVCLITGATNGIGRATAEALARVGANVILHGRSAERLDRAVAEIKSATGNANVSRLVADLSSLSEVRRLGAEINALASPLHVLINNAGVLNLRKHSSKDGYELQFAVNHLAHFLLTNVVLDKLKASRGARVVVVASRAHYGNLIDPDYLESRSGLRAYGRSKFANVLFAKELARRLSGSDVTSNALHPGVVWTNMVRQPRPPISWIIPALRPFLISPEEGAKTSVYLASSPEVAGVSGKYFDECKDVAADPRTEDASLARALWERSAALVKLG